MEVYKKDSNPQQDQLDKAEDSLAAELEEMLEEESKDKPPKDRSRMYNQPHL